MKTTVVNIRTHKYDVYIGRAGHGHDGYFGNPFSVMRDGGRERAIALYREYFYKRLRVDPEFAKRVEELRGKRLGCFCKNNCQKIETDDLSSPRCGQEFDIPCHGDIIADYLDIESKVKPYVDKLLKEGFYTFSSCDGGDGHAFKRRTIKINVDEPFVDYPYGCPISRCDEKRCFKRFIDLCNFVEQQRWTYCMVLLARCYVIKNDDKPEASVHFELVWN